ncbi:MAG: thioesterase domain-containing protein, partial [Gemmatimonadota bacterium]
RYVELIRGRQPKGPYYICAYSSSGAFVWEVTRRLEAEGETVAALILIDPMALDSLDRRRFGWWAARCSYANRIVRQGARVAGRMRTPFTRWAAGRILAGLTEPAQALTDREREELSRGAPYDPGLLRRLAILMELESGVPIPDLDVADGGPEAPAVLQRFRDAVAEAHPQLDAVRLERIARQYKLQVQHQRAYALRPIAAPVLMFEPETAYAGLLATLVRPFAGRLEAHRIPVGEPPPRSAELLETFMGWRIHYWCMRDDTFARGVAAELDRILAVPDEPADRPEPVRTLGIAGSNP